jgi:hypothetical protein
LGSRVVKSLVALFRTMTFAYNVKVFDVFGVVAAHHTDLRGEDGKFSKHYGLARTFRVLCLRISLGISKF